MGAYVNPKEETKERFLSREGTEIGKNAAKLWSDFGTDLLVVLVDNGPFTAAGIAYDAAERDAWLGDDTDARPMRFFTVPLAKLWKVSPQLPTYFPTFKEELKEL